ncbi:MAG: AAA family ATPase [Candidatus Hydrogenedentes bacterium]|nr:AAA family ATPase [Candidatus Hydrogenedentota bacterium]
MRFIKAHIFGYGKFVSHSIEFPPGFLIIYGPNESGKTTLFNFLLDMIFGQRTSSRKGAPLSENYYLFKPWNDSEYKGELCIKLDGRNLLMLLRRNFGDNGSLMVLEGMNPVDVTSKFPSLPNGEVAFAKGLLGITRDVFVNVATISIKTLDQLGSPDSIRRVKEHLIRLVDTGSLESSLEEILAILARGVDNYFQAVNASVESLKSRSNKLNALMDEQVKLRREFIRYKRHALLISNEIDLLEKEVENFRKKVDYSKKYALWRKKNDAKALQEQLDALISQYFAYSKLRDFPLHLNTQVVQLNASYHHLSSQRENIQRRMDDLTFEIDSLENTLRAKNFKQINNIHQIKEKFNNLNANVLRIESQIEEKNKQISKLEAELEEIQNELSKHPGLIKVNEKLANDIEAEISLYNSVVYMISEKKKKRSELDDELVQLSFKIHPLRKIFGEKIEITNEVMEYEKLTTEPQKLISDYQSNINELQLAKDNYRKDISTDIFVAVICFILSVILIVIFFLNPVTWFAVWLSAGTIIILSFFLCDYVTTKRNLTDTENLIKEMESKIEQIKSGSNIESHPVKKMMMEARAEHISELLGLHREYILRLEEEKGIITEIEKIDGEIAHLEGLKKDIFLMLKKMFEEIHLVLVEESEIEEMRQELIRLKDKAKEINNRHYELRKQISDLKREVEIDLRKLEEIKTSLKREVYDEVVSFFTEMGIISLGSPMSMETFLEYFKLQTEVEGLKKKVSEKREERERLYFEFQQIEASVSSIKLKLQEIFDSVGVKTIEEWNSSYEQAKKARELLEHINKTETELKAILGDLSLDDIEEEIRDFVPVGKPEESLEVLEKGLSEKQNRQYELKKQLDSVNSKLADILCKMEDVRVIEDEIMSIDNKLSTLEIDREAVKYVVSTLNKVCHDRELQVLSKLEAEVSALFSKITGNKYTGVKLQRNMAPLIFCPEKGMYMPLEELNLSQGTVDQLYFCIRVAILRAMCNNGEKLPMILDDPFLNYDTGRLTNAIQTLNDLGREHQIILFTCREDILTLAEILGINALRMSSEAV